MAKLTLEAVNSRLKAARSGVSVLQRGNRLYLYATLPPKPGVIGSPKQQQIALGIYANQAGLIEAELKAKELSVQLARGTFQWAGWTKAKSVSPVTIADWIESYRKFVFETAIDGDDQTKAFFWRERYLYFGLSKLNPSSPLSESAIVDAVRKTRPNSRMRQQTCNALQKFATFCGMEIDLSAYRGNYAPSQVVRSIPTDDEIVAAIDRVASPKWQRVFAIMAVYGLRDHEAWQCQFKWVEIPGMGKVLQCCVLSGKTGARSCLPLPQEWAIRWKLHEPGELPIVNARLNTEYGRRTAGAAKRQKLGFSPYSLRHRYAITGSVRFRLPASVMAAMMGHSVGMHLSTYNKHLSQADGIQAYSQVFGSIDGED